MRVFLAAAVLMLTSTSISTSASPCRLSIVGWTETRYVDVMSGASGVDREPVFAAGGCAAHAVTLRDIAAEELVQRISRTTVGFRGVGRTL